MSVKLLILQKIERKIKNCFQHIVKLKKLVEKCHSMLLVSKVSM